MSRCFGLAGSSTVIVWLAAGCLPLQAVSAEPADAIVTIYAKTAHGTSSQGTGAFISPSGRILTAYHVIQNASEIQVFDKNMRPLADVRIERLDARRDLATLASRPNGEVTSLKLALGINAPGITRITVVGSPRGLPNQVLNGQTTSSAFVDSIKVSSTGGKRVFQSSIEIVPVDVTVYSGMSGAPVVLTDGTIVGVLSGSFDEGRGIAWAIPSKYVSDLLKTPAIMQLPSTSFHWPSFALMSTSWVSLGRSYSKSFDASHLAQLESLEGLLRSIRGRWRGTADFRRTVFSDARHPLNPLGSCYAIGTVFTELEFVDVTVDTPHLLARHRVSQTVTDLQYEFGLEVKYGVAGTAESKAEARRKLFKGCGADESGRSPATTLITAGPVWISSEIGPGQPLDESYPTQVNVQECILAGKTCSAASFGKSEVGPLEVISSSKIRWQGVLLERQP